MAALDIFGDGSCKALYQFEDDLTDESGNHDATYTVSHWTYDDGTDALGRCIKGTAAEWTAPLQIASHSDFSSDEMALSFFAYWGTSGTAVLKKYDLSTPEYEYSIDVAGTNKIRLKAYNTALDTLYDGLSSTSVNGGWHHCILSKEDSQTLCLYVDGIKELTLTTPTSFAKSTSPIELLNNGINVKFDHLRLFNRSITDTEALTLLNENIVPPFTFSDTHGIMLGTRTLFFDTHSIQTAKSVKRFRDIHTIETTPTTKIITRVNS